MRLLCADDEEDIQEGAVVVRTAVLTKGRKKGQSAVEIGGELDCFINAEHQPVKCRRLIAGTFFGNDKTRGLTLP